MKKHINIQDPLLNRIGKIADRGGVSAFVVGGYVRDLLLEKQVKDIDIVIIGSGVEFATKVARELGKTNLVTFEKFGTAMLQLDDVKLEFVGARKESYSKDSRKPVVEIGTLEDDLSRRDFTVNAIAASLNENEYGNLFDPFGGQRDIGSGILRTPLAPKETFDDDPLRIMRAFRFAAQLGFTVEPSVLKAAEEMRERLKIVSQERITDEFLKILLSPKPSVGLKLMFDAGVMDVVFPEVSQLSGVDQRKDHHHKDVFLHTLKVVDNISETTDSLWLRLAALLHDIAKPRTKAFVEGTGWTFHGHEDVGARMVKPIFRKLKLPLEHLPYVEKLVRLHLRPMALVDGDVTDSAVRRLLFEAGQDIDGLMKLCRADITSKNPKLVEQVKRNYDNVVKKMQQVEEKDRLRNWQPPLRGDEIMQVCGLEPGPAVGRLKDAITDAILDGKIPNEHDAALGYLMEIKDEILSQEA
ncbi:MAG: CCA tRNA nucleotidyltransferase [Ignavibacteriae bacterium]|nr:CCA tRNA nucleotidyltransferase [Ignavibacteriota bacterium]